MKNVKYVNVCFPCVVASAAFAFFSSQTRVDGTRRFAFSAKTNQKRKKIQYATEELHFVVVVVGVVSVEQAAGRMPRARKANKRGAAGLEKSSFVDEKINA